MTGPIIAKGLEGSLGGKVFVASRTQPAKVGSSRVAVFARHFTEQELKGNGAPPKSEQPSSKATLRTNSFAPTKAAPPSSEGTSKSRFNIIERSRWPNGIPAVMGAHLMASGIIAPLSTSKGPGEGQEHLFFYPDKDQENYAVTQYVNADAGAKGLAETVKEISAKSIKDKGSFTIVLSGGSLLKALTHLAGKPGMDFSKWYVAYADERNVPHSHEDSNHKGATDAFLSRVNIPSEQVIAIKEGLSVKEAAKEYEGQLLRLPQSVLPRNQEGWPIFDLILLGIGPDGHVASLFPNHQQLSIKEGWILPVSDSPKPPPERITLSLPVINSAANVGIVAFGSGKAEIVQRALEVQSLPGAIPAQLVRPTDGALSWLLDCEAAAQLSVDTWKNTKDYPRSQ